MLDSGVLMSLAWNGSKIIAGSSNGFMACWNVEKCLLSANADPILIFHSRVHDSCIRIVQLIGTDKAPLIASGGSDGRVMLTDPTSPWSPYQFSRSRGFVTGLASNHNGGYFFTESDPVGRIRYQSAELMGYKLVGNHESNISVQKSLHRAWISQCTCRFYYRPVLRAL